MHDEQVSEALIAGWNGADSVKSLSVAIQKSIKPVNNTTLTPRYRKKMVRVLAKRAIEGFLQWGGYVSHIRGKTIIAIFILLMMPITINSSAQFGGSWELGWVTNVDGNYEAKVR